jgi:hypothetical protein
MIADSVRAARLALGSWPITVAAFGIYSLFGLMISEEPLLDTAVIAGMIIPCLIGIMVITYLMSRFAGAPAINEIGSVGRWFGWGLVAVLPLIAIWLCYAAIVGFENWANGETPVWIESILYVVAAIVGMPFYALSTGRAINGEGPDAAIIFAYCKRYLIPMIASGFALMIAPSLLTDAFLIAFGLDSASQPLLIIFGLGGGLSMLVLSLAVTGLSATIYRAAEREAANGVQP